MPKHLSFTWRLPGNEWSLHKLLPKWYPFPYSQIGFDRNSYTCLNLPLVWDTKLSCWALLPPGFGEPQFKLLSSSRGIIKLALVFSLKFVPQRPRPHHHHRYKHVVALSASPVMKRSCWLCREDTATYCPAHPQPKIRYRLQMRQLFSWQHKKSYIKV